MTPREAVAHTLWACADYNNPQPPGEAAALFLDYLPTFGFELREIA